MDWAPLLLLRTFWSEIPKTFLIIMEGNIVSIFCVLRRWLDSGPEPLGAVGGSPGLELAVVVGGGGGGRCGGVRGVVRIGGHQIG